MKNEQGHILLTNWSKISLWINACVPWYLWNVMTHPYQKYETNQGIKLLKNKYNMSPNCVYDLFCLS